MTMKLSCSQCTRLKVAIDSYIAKVDNDLKEALEDEGFVEADETIEAIKELEEELAAELKRESKYIKKKLEQCSTIDELKEVWLMIKSKDTFADEVRMLFSEIISPAMPVFTTAYLQQTEADMTAESITKKTTDWIRSWSEELAEKMQLSTHDTIEQILMDGINKKSSINEITRNIMQSGIRDEYYRARTTAITEVLRAHSYAQQEAMFQDPAATHRQWFHSGAWKIRPRKNHQEIDGQIVEKTQPFLLKGVDGTDYHPMVPRDIILPPGESINCHCIMRHISDKNILGMSFEERKKLQEEAKKKIDADWEEKFNAENRAKAGIDGPDNESKKSGIKYTRRDVDQYKKYQKVLDDIAPDSFDKFLEIKYNNIDNWGLLKHQYRVVNSYEHNAGKMSASKIYELHEIGINAKANFTGRARKQANMGVCEFDGDIFLSNSQVNYTDTDAYKNYKGDKSKLILQKSPLTFEKTYISVGKRSDTYVDSEAKFFEYASSICADGKKHTLKILSEKCMCSSCRAVMVEFQKKYPNATLEVVSGRADRVHHNKNKPWDIFN